MIEEGSTTMASRNNGGVMEASETDSAEAVQFPRATPTRLSLVEKLSLDKLASMIIPYSVCPLLPNFPFASSPTVFYPGLEAFLSGSEAGPDIRYLGVSSAKPDGQSDAASATDAHPLRTRPFCGSPRFEPSRSEGEDLQNEPIRSVTRESEHTTKKAVPRCGRRSFSDTWKTVGDRNNKDRPLDCFPRHHRCPRLLSTCRKEEREEWQQRVLRASKTEGRELSRSASETTVLFKNWLTDQLSCKDAANTDKNGTTPGEILQPSAGAAAQTELCNGDHLETPAGTGRTTKMITFDQMRSVAASLSLDRRLLFFLLLALPWAVTLAFYSYVPKRMRRQLQWLLPNALVLGLFIVALVGCLQWRFSILVDLMFLMIQLCTWGLLAFVVSASGRHSDSATGQCAGKCEPDAAESQTEYVNSPDGNCDRRKRSGSTASPVDLSEQIAVTAGDERLSSSVLTAAEQTPATTDSSVLLLPQEGTLPHPLKKALVAREIRDKFPTLMKGPFSKPNFAACVGRHAGKTWEGETANRDSLSQADVRDDDPAQPSEPPGGRTGKVQADRRMCEFSRVKPTSNHADLKETEGTCLPGTAGEGAALTWEEEASFAKARENIEDDKNSERAQDVRTGKAVAEEEQRSTLHIRVGRKFIQDVEVCNCRQELKEVEETLQQSQQLLGETSCSVSSWWPTATPETERSQSLGSMGLNVTCSRDGKADTTSVHETSLLVEGQQDKVEGVCMSSLEGNTQRNKLSGTGTGQMIIRAQPSLLLEDALKGVCVPFRFADVEPTAAMSNTGVAVWNEEWKQREEEKEEEYEISPDTVVEGGRGANEEGQKTPTREKRRALTIPTRVTGRPELLPIGEGRADVAATVTDTERAAMTANVKIVGAAEAWGECAADSSSSADVFFVSEKGPSLRHRMGEDNTEEHQLFVTGAFVDGRPKKGEVVSDHASAAGVPEKQEETMIDVTDGERCVDVWGSQQEQQQQQSGVYALFQKEGRQVVDAFFMKDLLQPFFPRSQQRHTDEKEEEGKEERREGRSGGRSMKEETQISTAPRTGGVATTEAAATAIEGENLSMALDRQKDEDINESLCFWPSFIQEQNLPNPLHLPAVQSPESTAAGQGDRCETLTASPSSFEQTETPGNCEADADCDLSEVFSYDLSADDFFSNVKEQQPSQYAAGGTGGDILLLQEEYRTRQHVAEESLQGQNADWSVYPRKPTDVCLTGTVFDKNMWQSDPYFLTLPGVPSLESGEGRGQPEGGLTLPAQQAEDEEAGLWLLPQLDDISTPKDVSTTLRASSRSVLHRHHAPEQQQEQEHLLRRRSQQMLLQSQPQHQQDFCFSSSGFTRRLLNGTENEVLWRTDTSLQNVCLLQERRDQNMSVILGDSDEQAARERTLVTTPAAFTEFLTVAEASSTSTKRGMPPVSGPEEAEDEGMYARQLLAPAICTAGHIPRAEYSTKAAGAAAVAPSPYAVVTPSYVAAERTTLSRTAHVGVAAPAPVLIADTAVAAFALRPAAVKETSRSVTEAATVRTEGATEVSYERIDANAEGTRGLVNSRRETVTARGEPLLTASAGLFVLPQGGRSLVANEQASVAGDSHCISSLHCPPKTQAAVAQEQHSEGVVATEEDDNISAKSPSTVATEVAPLVKPGAAPAGALRGRIGGRNSYSAKAGGGGTGRENAAGGTQGARSAETRIMMQHYMALVKECYRSRDSQGALQVLELLQKEKRVQPDTQLLNYILLVCVAAGSKDITDRLFNLMEESGCADLVTYNTVLKSCVEAEDLASAEKLLQRMQTNSNISPDGVTYNLMVNACVVCRRQDKAWEYIDKLKAARMTPDKFTTSSVIKSLQPGQNRQHIVRALKLMEGVNVCEDVLLLSTCLDACARLGEYNHLKYLLDSFEKSNLRLNAHAYGTVIKAYGRLGQIERVWALWQQQLQEKITPTSYTYGCMLDCLATNNQVAAALEMFQEMINAGVVDAMHVSVLVKGLSKHRAEGARCAIAAYQMLKCSHKECMSSPNESSRRSGKGKNGNDRGSSNCISISRSNIVMMATTAHRESLTGSGESTEGGTSHLLPNKGGDRADGATPRPHTDCYIQALNTISYNALVHLCVSTGYLNEALKLFEDMQQHPRATPDLITYSSIIKGLCCSSVPHGLEMALELFYDVQQRARIKADAIIYNTLIQGAATRKRVHLVELLLQHMIDNGVPPSSYTLCQCVKLYGKCNNLARVLELHRELPARFRFEVDEYVHTALIAACSQNGAPVLAARFALVACAAGQQLATSVLKKVLLDVQQRRQDTTEESDDMQTCNTTVDQVVIELKQLLAKRQVEEQQQQHQQQQEQVCHPQQLKQGTELQQQQQQEQTQQQRSWHPVFEERRRRRGIKQAPIIPEAEDRQTAACKTSRSSSCLTVSDVSTRDSGVSATLLLQEPHRRQELQHPRYNKKQQQHPQVQRHRLQKQQQPQLQRHTDQQPQRSEGGRQQYSYGKKVLSESRRDNNNKLYSYEHQAANRRGKEEQEEDTGTGRERGAAAKALGMKSLAGKGPTAIAFTSRTEATARATTSPVDRTGSSSSRAVVKNKETDTAFTSVAGRRPVDRISVVGANKRKGVIHADTAAETAAQTQHDHQAASQKPVRRGRRYYH